MSLAENGKPWPHSSLRDSWFQGFPLRAGHNAVERVDRMYTQATTDWKIPGKDKDLLVTSLLTSSRSG